MWVSYTNPVRVRRNIESVNIHTPCVRIKVTEVNRKFDKTQEKHTVNHNGVYPRNNVWTNNCRDTTLLPSVSTEQCVNKQFGHVKHITSWCATVKRLNHSQQSGVQQSACFVFVMNEWSKYPWSKARRKWDNKHRITEGHKLSYNNAQGSKIYPMSNKLSCIIAQGR